MLGALSDSTRQSLVHLLRKRAATVGELAEQLPVSRPAVSQHLQVLKSAGLVEEERRGTRHYFRLNPKSLADLRAHIESLWRDALGAFSDFAGADSVIKENVKNGKSQTPARSHRTKRTR
jgi:DNA-binding transcriptional ArsR family regulator